jgi:hypothetical protein
MCDVDMMPPDLVIFMKWIGLLETAAPISLRGVWYRDGEVPF